MYINNCQPVRNKAGLALDNIQDHDFVTVAVTETWLRMSLSRPPRPTTTTSFR